MIIAPLVLRFLNVVMIEMVLRRAVGESLGEDGREVRG